MKKRPKARVRSVPSQKGSPLLGWILLLLVLLLAVETVDLVMDHFYPREETQPEQTAVGKPETFGGEELSAESTEPAATTRMEIETKAEEQKPVETAVQVPSASEIKLQILNGCGVRGIASRVRGIMRDRGFDVMSFGNAARLNYPETLLLVRSEGKRGELAAEVVARSLGVNKNRIRIERDPSLVDIDVTVILGLDYKKLNL